MRKLLTIVACGALAFCMACLLPLPDADAAGARSPLFSSSQPGGVYVIANMEETTGNIFFVDSGKTSTGGATSSFGFSPDAPVLTIDAAIGFCTANNGDRIVVMPGHAETVTAGAGIDFDKAGVEVVGLGSGSDRPTVTFTTSAGASVHVDAANTTIRNILFVNGIANQTPGMIDVDTADFTITDCEFRNGAATMALTAIDLNGGTSGDTNRFRIERCIFKAPANGSDRAIELGEVSDAGIIKDCLIWGDYDDAGIHNITGKTVTNLTIDNCIVSNLAAGQHAIEMVSAVTGMLVNSSLYGDTIAAILDPGSLKCVGVMATDAVDQSGVAVPTTAASGFPADSITAATIANDAIDATAIADASIDAATFAASAIAAAGIASDAITNAKIANDAIGATEIANDAIDATAIADASIDAATFAASAIAAAGIAADAITNAKIANDAIGATEIANDAIDATAIADASIDAATFAASAIAAAGIASDAITAAKIADAAIDAATFAADAIANAGIADGALSEEQFDVDAANKLQAGIRVTKATPAITGVATIDLFEVAGGLVRITEFVGEVTVQMGADQDTTIEHEAQSMGALLVCDSDAAGQLYGLTGAPADAVIDGAGAVVEGMDNAMIVNAGTIEHVVAGATFAGEVTWRLTYVPLESGAAITAAP